MKFYSEDLNPGFCPPHPTNTYTYGVTITLRVCSGEKWKKRKRKRKCKLNVYNCVHFLKTVYIEYIELSKIFEKCAR